MDTSQTYRCTDILNTSQNLVMVSSNLTHPNQFSCFHLNSMKTILCAGPPTAVRNLRVIDTTTTSFGIQWDVPLVTGRPDYFYNVEYSNPNNILQYIQHNQRKITNTSIYPVTGLRPFTTYVIRVSVHNGVSGSDSANDAKRRLQISHTTMEGGQPLQTLSVCKLMHHLAQL